MKRTAAVAALAAAFILSMAACGGGGGSATPTSPAPSPTTSSSQPSASPSHSAQPGEPALIAVPGYDYVNPPADMAGEATKIVNADPQHLKSGSMHGVVHKGTFIAVIILIQVQPQYADLPETQQNLLPAMAEGMAGSGAQVRWTTIHGEKVAIAKMGSQKVYAWYHNGTITAVNGTSGSDVRDYVDAYLQAAHPTSM